MTPADTACTMTQIVLPTHTNNHGTAFGGQLAAYAQQMVAYLTYHGEDKPYPFASWPPARKGRKKKSAAKT